MAITMFDAIETKNLPVGNYAYAGYVGGYWPTYSQLQKLFPKSELLSIAINSSENAECLDVESGDATPDQVPAWVKAQIVRKVYRPVVYCSVGNMGSVMTKLQQAGISLSTVRLWTAHYAQGEHICGPLTCGQLHVNADGTQWTDSARGISLDQSMLLDNFFSTSTSWTYSAPQHLTATPGHTNVELNWSPPAGAPQTPAEYLVYMYKGTVPNKDTLVASYPRTSPKSPFTGGSLTEKTVYTAHVVASGPNGTRVAPDVYASVEFITGA